MEGREEVGKREQKAEEDDGSDSSDESDSGSDTEDNTSDDNRSHRSSASSTPSDSAASPSTPTNLPYNPLPPNTCPLCLQPWTNPTITPTGYVGCYLCLYRFVEREGRCPVTGVGLEEMGGVEGLRKVLI